MAPLTVYTIGHSTRPIERFVEILRAHSVALLVDVRTIARSRHNPQFNEDVLRSSLGAEGIGYVRMKGLGGLRHPEKDSKNTAWRNASFRGYADHMQTEEFRSGVEELMRRAAVQRSAIMCSEGNPYRCHRSLVADALVVRGVEVLEISSARPGRQHRLTPFAVVRGLEVTYPGPSDSGQPE